jgi:ubiquinone/menaquinone biosynthesis C-methylase UbiE
MVTGALNGNMVDSSMDNGRKAGATAYYSESELGPQTYDLIYAGQYPAMLDFYVSCARKYGGPVLEIGAGTGLVTWAIAADGHDVIGIDLSKRMLNIARAKKDENDPSTSERTEFREADMVDFQLGRKFKTAIIPGRSFQHLLTPGEQRSALACIHSHLGAGGMLIMNQFDPKLDYCLPNAEPPVKSNEIVDPESGRKIRRTFLSRTTDPLTQTFTENMRLEVFDDAGEKISHEETSWSLRWTYRQEMQYLLELSGFNVQEQLSDFLGAGPAYAKEQIWICQKS